MKSRRILILSALHLCRNPRVVKEATTLGRAGYDVTVMSVSASVRFERVDRELTRELPFRCVTLDLIGSSKATRLRSFLLRGATWLARAALKYFSIESPQALGPAYGLRAMARGFGADLTIVHTEVPLWIARSLIRDGCRVAVDFEDWYSEDLLYADRLGRPLRLLRRAEHFALNHASYVAATSDSMADALVQRYGGQRPIVIRNTFPLQPRTRLDRPIGNAAPDFIWFSQTVGPGRGLELFLSAWNQTQSPSRVVLLGDVRASYQQHLLSCVAEDRRDRLVFLPLVTPAELPDQLAGFDIGLALESHWPLNRDITITNKIIQYMNAGLALVATDTAGQTEIMRAAPGSGLLVAAHETTQLAAQLDGLIADPARRRECQHASRAAAASLFCWEVDAPHLLTAVERALLQAIA
jgi:glycosyltransferase involved in cell wall biosynthesis